MVIDGDCDGDPMPRNRKPLDRKRRMLVTGSAVAPTTISPEVAVAVADNVHV